MKIYPLQIAPPEDILMANIITRLIKYVHTPYNAVRFNFDGRATCRLNNNLQVAQLSTSLVKRVRSYLATQKENKKDQAVFISRSTHHTHMYSTCNLGDGVPPPFAVLPDMVDEELVLLAGPGALPPPVHLLLPSPAAERPLHNCLASELRRPAAIAAGFSWRFLCCLWQLARIYTRSSRPARGSTAQDRSKQLASLSLP